MRAVKRSGSSVEVVDVSEPSGDGVLVKVTAATICGSDVHMLEKGFGNAVLGHEFGGFLPDGTLAAIRPTGMCGSCDFCHGGREHLCGTAMQRFFGGALDGGFAEQVLVDANCVFPVEGITPSAVSLVEPLAVAVHGFRRATPVPGETVAVVGAGSVGLVAAAVAVHHGFECWIDARYPHQQVAAEAIGARVGIPDDRKFDVVFDAVGNQSAVTRSIAICQRGGRVVELGVFWDPITLGGEVTFREISLVPAVLYAHHHGDSDFQQAIEILRRRPELERILVTHRFGLDDAVEAFRVASDRSAGSIKVGFGF